MKDIQYISRVNMKVTVNSKMPFGRYKGRKIFDLPRGYLDWMSKKFLGGDFNDFALAAKEVLNSSEMKMEQESMDLDEMGTEFLKQHGYGKNGE